jgi:hypothetical protein
MDPGSMRCLAAAVLLAGAPGLAGCSGAAAAVRPDPAAIPAAGFGVEVQAPRRVAAGYLVEVRLRVLDAGRAAPLFDPAAPARLVPEGGGKPLAEAGARIGWPGHGAAPEQGRTYLLPFDNTGNGVAAGDRATLVLGPLELRGLVVAE